MACCLALALVQFELKPRDFVDEKVKQPLVQNLVGRVRHTPSGPSLIVELKDGSRLEEKLQHRSDLHGWEAVAGKFRAATLGVISASNAESIVDQLSNLESMASIDALTNVLRS